MVKDFCNYFVKHYKFLFLFFFIYVFNFHIHANTIPNSVIDISLFSTAKDFKARDNFDILIKHQLKDGWYIKKNTAEQNFINFQWKLNRGLTIYSYEFPAAQALSGKTSFQTQGYEKTFFIRVPVYVKNNESSKTLTFDAQYTVCHNVLGCKLEAKKLQLNFPVHDNEIYRGDALPKLAVNSWFFIIFFSFLGGMILNLMPCVLPMIPIKVLSFINKKYTKKHTYIYSLGFLLGTITTFLLLSFSLITLKIYGYSLGWGFQMQSPVFVYFLSCVFLIFALNLFGIFDFQVLKISSFLDEKKQFNNILITAFMSGFLSVVVSTPCGAPFMGTAIAYGMNQSWTEVTFIFLFMGIGLSTPFLILLNSPQLLSWFPKAGSWMITLKQLFGFFMLLTVLWLFWVLMGLTNNEYIVETILSFIVISFIFWILGKKHYTFMARFGFYLSALVVIFFVVYILQYAALSSTVRWVEYNNEVVDSLKEKGKPIFIDFTARWCLTCQMNKKFVLESREVLDAFKKNNVVLIRADWTHRSNHITKAIQSYGFSTIPLYVFYPKGLKNSKPIVIDSFITKDKIRKILENEDLSSIIEIKK